MGWFQLLFLGLFVCSTSYSVATMGTRLFPWANWQEWDQVRILLTAGSDYQCPGFQQRQHLQEGVARVKAWRCRGKVPLSLDVACSLTEAQLMDQQADMGAGGTQLSQSLIRTAYSLPIIRLVNGIADAQQRGKIAASVASLATAAGLPAMLVDIRHASTHGDLPSLAQLRIAAQQALLWIRGAYWDTQTAHLASMHARVCSILQALYTSWQTSIQKSKSKPTDQQPDEEEEMEQDDVGQQQGNDTQTPLVSAKQVRKDLLSELRSLILPSWSAALIHPLITTFRQTLTMQSNRQASEPQTIPTQDKKKRKRSQQAGNHQDKIGIASTQLDKALQSCLLQLMKVYPALGHQLVCCCMFSLGSTGCLPNQHSRACTCCQSTELLWWPVMLMSNVEQQQLQQQVQATDSDGPLPSGQPMPSTDEMQTIPAGYWVIPAEQARAWLAGLLPEASIPFRKTVAKLPPVTSAQRSQTLHSNDLELQTGSDISHGTVAAAYLPHISIPTLPLSLAGDQLMELLGQSLQGLSVLTEMSASSRNLGNIHSIAGDTLKTGSTHMVWIVERLASLLALQQVASHGKPRLFLELATMSLPNHTDKSEATTGKNMITADKAQAAARQKLTIEDMSLIQSRLFASATPQEDGIEQEPRKKWKRASGWHSCALGSMPSASIPSGVLPMLIPHVPTLYQPSEEAQGPNDNANNHDMLCQGNDAEAVQEQDDDHDVARQDGCPRFGGWCVDGANLEMSDNSEEETDTTGKHRVAGSWLTAEQLIELGMQVKFL